MWSKNGYVYHTKYDKIDYIPVGSLQRAGDNILALVKEIANAYQLADVEKYREGNLIFFDFLGAFVVRWSEFVSNLINIGSIIFSIFTIYRHQKGKNNIFIKIHFNNRY